MRVFNVIKTWLDKHFYDFENDPTLVNDLLVFTETLGKTGMEKSAIFLKEFLSRKKENMLGIFFVEGTLFSSYFLPVAFFIQ